MKSAKNFIRMCFGAAFLFFVLSFCNFSWAGEGALANPEITKWAFLSAAIVMGLSAIGAGVAVAYVGSAAVGAMSEKPEIAGRAIMYVGLAEGLAILGFAVAFIILSKV